MRIYVKQPKRFGELLSMELRMSKRITIKDIAQEAGVSVSTVHYALSGKSGVGEETRSRIVTLANELGYRSNALASSLKRKVINIAVVLPGNTEMNRLYYSFLWEGVEDYFSSLKDFNIAMIPCPYYLGTVHDQAAVLNSLDTSEINGIITINSGDFKSNQAINKWSKIVPTVVLLGEIKGSKELCVLSPSYSIIGQTVAEYIYTFIDDSKEVFLFCGDLLSPAHNRIEYGFEKFAEENCQENHIYKVHSAEDCDIDVCYENIKKGLLRPNIGACYSVNARGSILLGKALQETGLAGKIIAVGNDIFDENCQFLKNRVFNALINKHPYQTAYQATKILSDLLIKGEKPGSDFIRIGSELVLRSSLSMYDDKNYRLIR